MTNCCGQQPLLFVVLLYACLNATFKCACVPPFDSVSDFI